MPGSYRRKNYTNQTLSNQTFDNYDDYKKELVKTLCGALLADIATLESISNGGEFTTRKDKSTFADFVVMYVRNVVGIIISNIPKHEGDKSGSMNYFRKILRNSGQSSLDSYKDPNVLAADYKKTGRAFEKTRRPLMSCNTALVNIKSGEYTIVDLLRKIGKLMQNKKILEKIRSIGSTDLENAITKLHQEAKEYCLVEKYI